MANYEVVNLLWSPSQERYVQPGELIWLEGEIEAVLLEAGHVKPAVAPQPVLKHETPRSVVKMSKGARGVVAQETEEAEAGASIEPDQEGGSPPEL